VARTFARIRERSPKYAAKIGAHLARMSPDFINRAEKYLTRFEEVLVSRGKDLDYGIDCHLRLRDEMLDERMQFLRTKHYSSSSFTEVQRRVYANPEIMEYHMFGLVFSQFFWREQAARLEFFCTGLSGYRDRIDSYLEIGAGHGLYIASAMDMLPSSVVFELVDVSATSVELACGMTPSRPNGCHLCDILEFSEQQAYDLIVAGEVLEHLEAPRTLLAAIRRRLSPRGRAFISTPVNAPTVDHIYLFHHAEEIRDLLRSERFVIEREATCYAEELPAAKAETLKVAEMFAALVRVDQE